MGYRPFDDLYYCYHCNMNMSEPTPTCFKCGKAIIPIKAIKYTCVYCGKLLDPSKGEGVRVVTTSKTYDVACHPCAQKKEKLI